MFMRIREVDVKQNRKICYENMHVRQKSSTCQSTLLAAFPPVRRRGQEGTQAIEESVRGEWFTSSQGWSSTPVVPQAGPSATSLCFIQLSAFHVSTWCPWHHCLNANGNYVQSWARSKAVHGSAKCSGHVQIWYAKCSVSPGLFLYSLRAVKNHHWHIFLNFLPPFALLLIYLPLLAQALLHFISPSIN